MDGRETDYEDSQGMTIIKCGILDQKMGRRFEPYWERVTTTQWSLLKTKVKLCFIFCHRVRPLKNTHLCKHTNFTLYWVKYIQSLSRKFKMKPDFQERERERKEIPLVFFHKSIPMFVYTLLEWFDWVQLKFTPVCRLITNSCWRTKGVLAKICKQLNKKQNTQTKQSGKELLQVFYQFEISLWTKSSV